jgi:hypothetical protein
LTSSPGSVIVRIVQDGFAHAVPGPRQRGRQLAWSLVLQVVALFLLAELSGMAHAGIDLYETLAGFEHREHDDCGDEEAGHECPPGCPNCHCFHAGAVASAVQLVATALIPLRTRVRQAGALPRVGVVPPGADPDSLYRPPRLNA